MNFKPLEPHGLAGISLQKSEDERGSLTRIWNSKTMLKQFNLNQASYVSNPRKHTLRGLHFQEEPFSENKVVLCISGRVFDVVVDLRDNSQTFGKFLSLELGEGCEFQGLFIPSGFAHGYLTLIQMTSLMYFMDKEYSPSHAMGVKWDSPAFGIKWPAKPEVISSRDLNWPSQ